MAKSAAELVQLPLPNPVFSTPFQNGITDPIWPVDCPDNSKFQMLKSHLEQRIKNNRIGPIEKRSLSEQALIKKYNSEYAGRVAGQKFLSILRADVLSDTREELIQILKLITSFAVEQMTKLPSQRHVKILEDIPDSYRVTITLGLGASLFTDKTGFDRFGLRTQKPKFLKPMPTFPGDSKTFDPTQTASDFIFLIATDHPYINVAAIRYFAEYFNKRFRENIQTGKHMRDVLKFYDIEEGFTRKDKREFLKFDDGIDNLHMVPDDLTRIIYVEDSDNEPNWCVNGTYMVYRKIRENMPVWEDLSDKIQEGIVGRFKETGEPQSRKTEGADKMTPVFPDPLDPKDGPLDSHIRKVQPRRPAPDLFGINDKERRFLRRPYPFFDGLDESGNSINGLQFLAFMKSIQQQFEHVVNMWQMNPDFPEKDTGVDALYANEILSNVDGGYYFCPPGLKYKDDFFGSGMFDG